MERRIDSEISYLADNAVDLLIAIRTLREAIHRCDSFEAIKAASIRVEGQIERLAVNHEIVNCNLFKVLTVKEGR